MSAGELGPAPTEEADLEAIDNPDNSQITQILKSGQISPKGQGFPPSQKSVQSHQPPTSQKGGPTID